MIRPAWTLDDLHQALKLFPPGNFSAVDAYDVAIALGHRKSDGGSLWNQLVKHNLVERSDRRDARGFWWKRRVADFPTSPESSTTDSDPRRI